MEHGECAQPCRWKYSIVEEKRPGQYFPIEQTENGAYLFNSQDMNMLGHLDDLIDSGATSLKIEGRAKSAYYIAAMTNAYKMVDHLYIMTKGGPDNASNMLLFYVYQKAFDQSNTGVASAVTVVLIAILLIATSVHFFTQDRRTFYA